MSKQRETVYSQRREVLLGADEDVEESIEGMIADFVEMQLAEFTPLDADHDSWDVEGLQAAMLDAIPQLEGFDFAGMKTLPPEQAHHLLIEATADAFDARKAEMGADTLNQLSRYVLLQVVDQHWKEHLHGMDVLAAGHRPARLRSARSVYRVQVRSHQHVQ